MMKEETELDFNWRLVRLITSYWAERGRVVDIDVVPSGRSNTKTYMLFNREPWPSGIPPRRAAE